MAQVEYYTSQAKTRSAISFQANQAAGNPFHVRSKFFGSHRHDLTGALYQGRFFFSKLSPVWLLLVWPELMELAIAFLHSTIYSLLNPRMRWETWCDGGTLPKGFLEQFCRQQS